jgi:hypothetical protein
MLARRLGRGPAREVAASATLDAALAVLAGSAYGRGVRAGMDLAAAQRAVAETALWHVRVLAGWAPPRAVEPIRALAAWFELVNVEERLAYLAGGPPPAPFELGGLATAWPRIAAAQGVAELRAGLAGSPWGDPGGDDPRTIRLALRMAWGRRVLASVEEAVAWAAGAVALLLARELFLVGTPAAALEAQRPPPLGGDWTAAGSVRALAAALSAEAAWALDGVDDPADLWRAEAWWWRRVEADAGALARHAHLGMPAVVGSIVLLGVDARRAAAALEVVARGGDALAMEVFEQVA